MGPLKAHVDFSFTSINNQMHFLLKEGMSLPGEISELGTFFFQTNGWLPKRYIRQKPRVLVKKITF